MTNCMPSDKVRDYYTQHAMSCAHDDFWGQVKRSINGRPVDQDQIDLIVEAITNGLQLRADDVLLDLCCGNGVLTDRIFNRCSGGLGVDFVDYLIGVANTHFAHTPDRHYLAADVEQFTASAGDTERFTKVLCYGSFQYLPAESAQRVLSSLHTRFPNVERVFLGNLPDKSRMSAFYRDSVYEPGIENDNESLLGIWRTPQECTRLAESCGWKARIAVMPSGFFASHYRFDAILER